MFRPAIVAALIAGWAAPVTAAGADPPVIIAGDSVCPSPAEIASRMAPLEIGTARGPRPVARVDRSGATLRVALADEHGATIAARTLPASARCAELADVVAVTITTWLTELRPEWSPVPRLPSEFTVAAPPPARGAWAGEVGAGVGASVGEGGAAGAACLLLSWHAGASGVGAIVRATATTSREVSIGARTAGWRRWDVTAGPSYQLAVGPWRVAGGVGFSAGWLSADGIDLAVNQSGGHFSPGVGGLIRVARAAERFSPWLAVGASFTLFDQPLVVTGSDDRRTLKAFTVDALLGLSLGRFP